MHSKYSKEQYTAENTLNIIENGRERDNYFSSTDESEEKNYPHPLDRTTTESSCVDDSIKIIHRGEGVSIEVCVDNANITQENDIATSQSSPVTSSRLLEKRVAQIDNLVSILKKKNIKATCRVM